MRFMIFFTQFILLLGISQTAMAQSEIYAKIRTLRTDGRFAVAMDVIDDQLKKNDPKMDANLLNLQRAMVLRDWRKDDEAEHTFRLVAEAHPLLEDYARLYLAQLYLQRQDTDSAREQFNAILKLNPNSKLMAQAQFELARLDNDRLHFREARAILQKQEKRTRNDEIYPELILQLARSNKGVGDRAGFCKFVRKLYSRYPDFAKISDWGFELEKNNFEAKPTMCSATPEDRHYRIKNLQWAGFSAKAKQEIDEVTKKDPDEGEELLVGYLMHEGSADQVLKLLTPQYEKRSHDVRYLLELANAYANMSEIPAAVDAFYAAYKQAPRGKSGKQSLFQAAFLSYQIQNYEGATNKFQEFMRLFGSSSLAKDAKWHLAWIRYLRNDFEGALTSFAELQGRSQNYKKVSRAFATDKIQYWQAMSYYRLGKFAEARSRFETLASDRLLGFYSLAAESRLKKIAEISPPLPKRVLPDANLRIGKLNNSPVMVPSEDLDWFKQNSLTVANPEGDKRELKRGQDSEAEPDLFLTDMSPRGEDEPVAIDDEVATPFANPILEKRFDRARSLVSVGLADWARWELFDIEKKTTNREYLRTLMEQYEQVDSFNRSSYIGQVVFSSQRANQGIEGARGLWEHTYPRAYGNFVQRYSKLYGVPAELIWGIMRAESQYKKDVISPVGALGLMQVMPTTGLKVSASLGEKDFDVKTLMQPESAIRIGAKYLLRLAKKFNGNSALIAGAYNAGPHRVWAWLSGFGHLDQDEFIEHIPYLETRNYVKKVLTNMLAYQRLYGGKKETALSISLSEAVKIPIRETSFAKENWD